MNAYGLNKNRASLLQDSALRLISLYQITLSPDHGFGRLFFPYWGCRFTPSCSEYAKQCIIEYGAKRGIFLGLKQLARCHPLRFTQLSAVQEEIEEQSAIPKESRAPQISTTKGRSLRSLFSRRLEIAPTA